MKTIYLWLIVFLAFAVTPNAVVAQLAMDDILAGMKQNNAKRQKITAVVEIERSFPDRLSIAKETTKAFKRSKVNTAELEASLVRDEEFASNIAEWKKLVLFQERNDQLLVVRTSGSEDEVNKSLRLPVGFDVQSWGQDFDSPVELFVMQSGQNAIHYRHDPRLKAFHYSIKNDAIIPVDNWSNSMICGMPFEIIFDGTTLATFAFDSFFKSHELSVNKTDGGVIEIQCVDTPQSINFLTNQDGKKYSVRNRTTIQVDSAKGYLPISIVKNIQYFCDDIPIQLAQGWDAFNISWKINIGELDGYFYPSSIEYSNIVPFSTEVDTPSVFLSPDRFVEILQNPPDSTVVPKCYERYRVRVVSLKNTLEADLGGLEIPPPPNALVFDESKN